MTGPTKYSRSGESWTTDEDEIVKQKLIHGRSFQEISQQHQRSPWAIQLRAFKFASEEIANGIAKETACGKFGLSTELYDKIIERERSRQSKTPENTKRDTTAARTPPTEPSKREPAQSSSTKTTPTSTEYTRRGQVWTSEEEVQLKQELSEGLEFHEISIRHERSVRAIEKRAVLLVARSVESGMSEPDALQEFNISKERYEIYRQRSRKRHDDSLETLQLAKKLKCLVEKNLPVETLLGKATLGSSEHKEPNTIKEILKKSISMLENEAGS